MTKLLKTIILAEGISHIEDLPVREFIRTVETLNDKIITEKLDGANLWFGLDDKGLYTSREGKSSHSSRFYNVSDYKPLAAYNGFRAAHLALEKVEPTIRKYLKQGDAVEIEVLFGRQPNTVVYGAEGKNYIVILRGVHGTPEDRVQNLADALDGKEITVKSAIASSEDGNSVKMHDEDLHWKFTKVKPISASTINTKEALAQLAKLKSYLEQSNKAFSDKTNGDVAEMSLTSVPKGERAEAKNERDRVNEIILKQYKQPIKELLLDRFVRKIKPVLQDPELHPSEDIGVEGVVVRDPITGNQTKIVDRDVFTAINSFNAGVRSGISSMVRTADSTAPLEARGGVFGDAKIRIAELIGAKELAVASQARRYVQHYKKSDVSATALALANHLDIKSVPAARTKIASILKGSLQEIDNILGQFKKEAGEYKLKLKTGKEVGITPEVMSRTLTAFAETKKEINEIISKVLSSRTAAQLLLALYGRTINSLFDEGDTEVKEAFVLIKSVSEDDGGGSATTSAGDVAPPEKRLFQGGKEIIKRKRNFFKPPKFPAPSGGYSLIKSVNEDWAHVGDMKFATDVDDTAQAKGDVEFKQLRNNVNVGDNINQMDVSKYLDKAHEINDQVDTVAYGLETDTGKVVKVYVNASQAEAFEKAMSELLGQEDDIEAAVNTLAQKFDIVDVEWPADLNGPEGTPVDGQPGDTPTQDGLDFTVHDNDSEEAQNAIPLDAAISSDGEASPDGEGTGEDGDDEEIDDGEERDDFGQIKKKKGGDEDEDEDADATTSDEEGGEEEASDEETDGDETSDEEADADADADTDEVEGGEEVAGDDNDGGDDKPKKKKKKKVEKTEESVSLHKQVLAEDGELSFPNPTLQAISDMLITMGFDLMANRSFAYQAKTLQARNSPGLIAAKNSSVVSKQKMARDALTNAAKLAPGAVNAAASAPAEAIKFTLIGSMLSEGAWERLVNMAEINGGDITDDEAKLTKSEIEKLSKEGWTESEIVELLKNTEHINPKIPEVEALNRMAHIKARVQDRLKVNT